MNLENPTIQIRAGSEQRHPHLPEAAEQAIPEVQAAYIPPIDIHESGEGLTLEADLPGATERNLQIHLEDNVLNLYAKIDSPAPEGARLIHEEYRLGDYHRSFILSDEVDRERITADLKNGVLRLFLPKADRARTRRIEIKS
jgi:HSP20 family molecular chaperone IbpA